MAKRFTDTNKYKKPFIRGLQGAYKLLWDYLYHDCDHAGIWIVDFEIAQILIGNDMPVNKKDAIKFFNDGEQRIIEVDNGKKWFIPSFIEFQYGELNPENRAHNSVITILKKYNLWNDTKGLIKGLTRGLQGRKDKDKDKDIISKGSNIDSSSTWRNDFEIYKSGLREVYLKLINDKKYINEQARFYPNVDIKLSLEKACTNFWATEAGWKNKKSKRSKNIDWKSTLTNAIEKNKVYFT
jgi:hypothetical protein